jgi:uncharacterized protein (TIGR00369 family)
MKHTRTTTWSDPLAMARMASRLSGIEFLRWLIEEEQGVPIGITLGFSLVEVDDGVAIFEAEAGPWAYNPIGSVHGGWYSAVLDAALGCALHTTLPAGVGYTTLEIKVNVVRAVRPDTGALRAVGRLVHRGRRTAVTEARLEDREGRLYAHATSTCLILDAGDAAGSKSRT